jgi:hypothetical protein
VMISFTMKIQPVLVFQSCQEFVREPTHSCTYASIGRPIRFRSHRMLPRPPSSPSFVEREPVHELIHRCNGLIVNRLRYTLRDSEAYRTQLADLFRILPVDLWRNRGEIPAQDGLFDPRAPAIRRREPQHQIDTSWLGQLNRDAGLR